VRFDDRYQDRVDRRTRLRDRIIKLGERLGRIVAVLYSGFQMSGGIGNPECADRACRTFQGVRQRTRVGWQGGESADQPDRLGREHRQHLALEAGIAKRHALEMFDIDRAVIGSERRRWHPVNLFQMKRHGDNPNLLATDPAAKFPSANHGTG
jgi:hypothetical protein